MSEPDKYIKITHGHSDYLIVSAKDDLCEQELTCFLDDAVTGDLGTGDRLVFEIIEMTDEEFEELPEFTGW